MRTVKAPQTRSECLPDGILYKRPCPYVRCKYNLLWSVNKQPFGVFSRLSDEKLIDILFSMKETCCLDVVDRGEITLDEIGALLFMSRERVRQMIDYTQSEARTKGERRKLGALQKIRHYTRRKFLQPFIDGYDSFGRVVIDI